MEEIKICDIRKSLSRDSSGKHLLFYIPKRYWFWTSLDLCKELGFWEHYFDRRFDIIERVLS